MACWVMTTIPHYLMIKDALHPSISTENTQPLNALLAVDLHTCTRASSSGGSHEGFLVWAGVIFEGFLVRTVYDLESRDQGNYTTAASPLWTATANAKKEACLREVST